MNTRRKLLIACGAALASTPLRARAQQRQFRIAYLSPSPAASPGAAYFDLVKRRLRELGYVEESNITFDSRWAESKTDRLPALAVELVGLKPDVFIASTTLAVRAAQQATASIPIVMVPVTDPVGSGFVKSLARPGGNLTGVANLLIDISAKSVELLHDLVPRARRIGILHMPRNPTHASQLAEAMKGIKQFKLTGIAYAATSADEIDQVFAAIKKDKCDALVVLGESLFSAERHRLARLEIAARLPVMYQQSGNVDAGGLISYGTNIDNMFRMAAGYVDKILKGAKPEDLPVEQPTRLEMVVNGKTAKALGLKIPESILLRADRVIE